MHISCLAIHYPKVGGTPFNQNVSLFLVLFLSRKKARTILTDWHFPQKQDFQFNNQLLFYFQDRGPKSMTGVSLHCLPLHNSILTLYQLYIDKSKLPLHNSILTNLNFTFNLWKRNHFKLLTKRNQDADKIECYVYLMRLPIDTKSCKKQQLALYIEICHWKKCYHPNLRFQAMHLHSPEPPLKRQ